MTATVFSINFELLILDNLWIEPQDLSQLLGAIYEKEMMKKIHLLKKIEEFSSERGIKGSDLAYILLQDFIEVKEKNEKIKSRPREKFDEFFGTASPKKKVLNFEDKDEEDHFIQNDKKTDFIPTGQRSIPNSQRYSPSKKSGSKQKKKQSKKKTRKELLM